MTGGQGDRGTGGLGWGGVAEAEAEVLPLREKMSVCWPQGAAGREIARYLA